MSKSTNNELAKNRLTLTRRDMLLGSLAVSLGFTILGKMSNAATILSTPAPEGMARFMKISASLTGVPDPAADLGQIIYQGLIALNTKTPELVTQLEGHLVNGKVTADAPTEVRTLATLINKAWYLGIVGDGEQAHCVAYEHALNYAPIADVCVLPTYARGEPHYWAKPPFADSNNNQSSTDKEKNV